MLEYDNAAAHADIQFERVGDVLTIKLPNEGFARGAGSQLRSPHFWLVIALFSLIFNLHEVFDCVQLAFEGRLFQTEVRPQSLALFFLQPEAMVCVYVAIFSRTATTIRLYRNELARSARGIFGTMRETAFARREIRSVHVGWVGLSIDLDRRRWLGLPHRVPLFTGRTRAECERVAAAIRNWLDRTPAELRP